MPFEDSRRLTGANLFFASPGAVLEVVGTSLDDDLIAVWRARVGKAAEYLGWPDIKTVARKHDGGVSLAISAPCDQLLLATEINEWALSAALVDRDSVQWSALEGMLAAEALQSAGDAPGQEDMRPVIEQSHALARFARLASREAQPPLRAIIEAAASRGLPHVLDEVGLTLGSGAGGHTFSLQALPDITDVPWNEIYGVPTAAVTGSNGKTTTVRLIAACLRAHGWHVGYNCTDGVYLDDAELSGGDYSGPAGARWVMREQRAQAAVLETARGGILRRGIAVSHARCAVVTNVSADHFGEYGIDDLTALAQTKLAVAAIVEPHGLLILTAEDPYLRAQARTLANRFDSSPPLGWFSAVSAHELADDLAATAAATCHVRERHLILRQDGTDHDLGLVRDMPLSMDGSAAYNIANMAAAALAATSIGVEESVIASVFARFGSDRHDNPGRMMRFDVGGITVLIDYAHNPDGLRGFLAVAQHVRGGSGRLGMLLGQAGNRKDADIEALAQVAAEFSPDLVVVKENETQLRGRKPGEVPLLIQSALRRLAVPDVAIHIANSEGDAARFALAWARPGDTLALPLHSSAARTFVLQLVND